MTTAPQIFKIANTYALLGWIILLFFPTWIYTQSILIYSSGAVLGGLYVYLLVTNFGKTKGSFTTLNGVTRLFQDPVNVLLGWVQYLAFDLMTGLFISNHALQTGFNRILLIPCLLLTFLFGPAGLLLYLILQAAVYGFWF